MAKKAIPSLQPSDAFDCTPDDIGDITNDPGNTNGYTFVYLHNYGTSGVVDVTLVDMDIDDSVTIFIPQGTTAPDMIKKVWATGLGAGVTLTAKITRGGSF
jgi:hypothetical protein